MKCGGQLLTWPQRFPLPSIHENIYLYLYFFHYGTLWCVCLSSGPELGEEEEFGGDMLPPQLTISSKMHGEVTLTDMLGVPVMCPALSLVPWGRQEPISFWTLLEL